MKVKKVFFSTYFALLAMAILLMTSGCESEETFTLSVSVNPAESGEVTGAGNYEETEVVRLVATPNEDFEFVNWTEGGTELSTSESYSYVMPGRDVTLTANFQKMAGGLILLVNPEGAGEVTGAGDYSVGENVTVSATPNLGYDFVNWTDEDNDVVSTEAEFSYTISEPSVTLTANFETIEVTDADGNVYQTVVIGEQLWMVENLRTTKYNDGTDIAVEDDWSELTTGAYTWQDNDESHKDPYGALYNWHAGGTGKLCPAGWRVPTSEDWDTLIEYLGGPSVAGVKLKEAGHDHWAEPNNGDNESGFTALPGGFMRGTTGAFNHLTTNGYYWHGDEYSETQAGRTSFRFDSTHAGLGTTDKRNGFSVRCMKEQ